MTREQLAQQIADIIAERYEDIETFQQYYACMDDAIEGILCGEWGISFNHVNWRSIRPTWIDVFNRMPELWGSM